MTTPTALVTGGATGIGRATAIELGKRGYRVAVNHLHQTEEADRLADEIGGLAFDADVADPLAVQAMVAAIEEQLGPIEVAACCAGFDRDTPIEDTDDDAWDRSLRVLLGGCVNVIAATAPLMSERRSGSVVTISSELALAGDAGHVAYVTAKAAILGLTRAMALELAPSGIRVNSIAPGPTDTAMLTGRWRHPDYVARIPLGRFGSPGELAVSIVDLAEATWTTGQVLSPNGGIVIQ
jgi:NAD(P)-dependent dehydrogenase (short-subunit alcohol dehydrogenase family)